jgi:copper chaperone CopZ
MAYTTGTQLLHWTESRVRLKNRALRESQDLATRVEETLRGVIGIRNVKASRMTATLVVEFDASAWRDPEATRIFWTALCTLFPGSCTARECLIPVGDSGNRPAVRDAVVNALETMEGVTDVRYESASQVVRVQFDPQRFALEPVLRSLTERVARSK